MPDLHQSKATALVAALLAAMALSACGGKPNNNPQNSKETPTVASNFASEHVLLTAESGAKLQEQEPLQFRRAEPGADTGTAPSTSIIRIDPTQRKQTMTGVGTSFTESSAFVLAHLEADARAEVMQAVYGADGANFALARTHIGSTDFSVEGRYSYADRVGDKELQSFTIAHDKAGFPRENYPGVRDENFDLLPMIQEAQSIKQQQGDAPIRIIASAWTAPAWMKDIEDWFIRGAPENNFQGTGGRLKPEYEATYADYLLRYLSAYRAEGVDIWGLTPVNEPHGNSGQWESMHFTPETQRDFIKQHLGPKLAASDHSDIRLLIYDQNRDSMEHWAEVILGDPEAAQYVYGTAVHWYESTYKVYEDALQAVHDRFPAFDIIHTEGTIDDLGKPAPEGIADPEGFQESGWFQNDAFWWHANASDWAYTASWAPKPEDHPLYTPVHRYARNIIVSFNHWMSGWIDWNIVLDERGGPNHVGNFCGAPIMIDTASGEVYYTPIYYVLTQFSRTIRPGDVAISTDLQYATEHNDALYSSATINADGQISVQILNTSQSGMPVILQVGDYISEFTMPANGLQTVQLKLP